MKRIKNGFWPDMPSYALEREFEKMNLLRLPKDTFVIAFMRFVDLSPVLLNSYRDCDE